MEYNNLNKIYKTDFLDLYHCDCMELLRQTPDNYYSLALVDPPYGIGVSQTTHHQNNTIDKITNYTPKEWDNNIPTSEYWNELFRVSKNQFVWGGNYFTKYLKPTKDWIIWDKEQPEKMHFAQAELCWCSFGRGVRIFKRSITKDKNNVSNNHLKALKYCRIHPTQKPVQLYKWLLQNYAKQGDTILDTHFGSLSIGIACHDMGFELTAIELDKDYYQMAKQRLLDFKKQLTIEF